MAMPRNRPAPKETEPIRAHKNQNTIEGKQKAGGWGRFAPQPPALIDKVSRMSRNEVSRMSWNLTLKHAPPMRRSPRPSLLPFIRGLEFLVPISPDAPLCP